MDVKEEPRYIQIYKDILANIQSGSYALDSCLPTEHELSKHYGVSRPTVRQALSILSREGYIDKRKRRGTVVTQPKIQQAFASGVQSFEVDMAKEGHSVSSTVLLFRTQKADAQVAEQLSLDSDEEVYKLVRLRYVDEQPNVFVESYVPCRYYPGLDAYDFNHQSLYQAMAELGPAVTRATRYLELQKADATTAALLDMTPHDAVYYFTGLAFTKDNQAVEFSHITYRGESNRFCFEIRDLPPLS
ncbi:GntR family transcriptional regulator [Collinsella sp. zg1085]|uniref:GntR family transcriptional regulator n=1 Tax=Collinsella sp. zg1085 TaxID=2844380 RepID=UPI001C0BD766|nr:GntR family transcriptional regulator [Collinsella sp. zg1085]QWT18017.1 GntR family transcriptional regulator [Collinsella sp. zg1085]